jgi:hypothetical protein
MKDNVKEFHLVAEPVVREIAPGMKANLWGYNGQSPGPTIEAVEGDRVRIFVTNKLPEVTTVHWHGVLLPSGMDGVSGLTQPPIGVGKTFMYEFVLQRSGTFMYHPHADEMVQMAMGMMGLFIVHPKDPKQFKVDRDGFIKVEPALALTKEKFVGALRLPGDETGDCCKFSNRLAEMAQGGFDHRLDQPRIRLAERRGRGGQDVIRHPPIAEDGGKRVNGDGSSA